MDGDFLFQDLGDLNATLGGFHDLLTERGKGGVLRRTCSLTNEFVKIFLLEAIHLLAMVVPTDHFVLLTVESGELDLLLGASLVFSEYETLSGTGVLGVAGYLFQTIVSGASLGHVDLELLTNESGVDLSLLATGQLSVLKDVLHTDFSGVMLVLGDTFVLVDSGAVSLDGLTITDLDDLGLLDLLGLGGHDSLGGFSEFGFKVFKNGLNLRDSKIGLSDFLSVILSDLSHLAVFNNS